MPPFEGANRGNMTYLPNPTVSCLRMTPTPQNPRFPLPKLITTNTTTQLTKTIIRQGS